VRIESQQCSSSDAGLVRRYAVLCEAEDELPDLQDFLAGFPTATSRQKADVVLIDQAIRWRDGRGPLVEDYFAGFPDVAAEPTLKLELILAEFDYQSQLEKVDEQAFVARFPELGEAFEALTDERDSSQQFPVYSEMIRRVFDEGSLLTTCWAATTIVRTTHERINSIASGRTILGQCSPFEQLPSHVIRLIESHMFSKTYRPGEYLIRQGEIGDSLIVVCDGAVEISTEDEDGTTHFLTRSDQLQVLGEMSLLMEGERNANVIADENVQAMILPVKTFHDLASQFPSIRVVLSLLLSERLGHADRKDVLSGKTLHGYRINKRLGKGGMSVVYEADDLERDRTVALKMMSHRLVYNEEAQQQFQREADIVQSLEHPNIVRVFDRFNAFHTCFIVMEFCSGRTLYQILKQHGALSAATVRSILGHIACALQHAHQSTVVHRDIKPGNIMVDDSGKVRLMDFGLATSERDPGDDVFEALVGTPRYMSPEQLSGNRGTPATDIFALGCVVYELLLNEPVFTHRSVSKLLRVHALWPGLDDSIREKVTDPELLAFLQNALQKMPADRHVDLESLSAWAKPIVLPETKPA